MAIENQINTPCALIAFHCNACNFLQFCFDLFFVKMNNGRSDIRHLMYFMLQNSERDKAIFD